MATTAEYLTQLQTDKSTLVTNLVAKGVDATNDETFTSLVPKVANIQGGVDINDYFKPTIAAATNIQNTNGVNAIIKKIPDTITLSGDSCASMFQYCSAITTIPLLDTSGVTDMRKMFYNCNSLQKIPLLNTSEVTNMTGMFNNCTNLQMIPAIDTSKVTTFENTFFACYALKTLPLLDMSSVTSLYGTFAGVTDLTHSSGFSNLGKAYLTTSATNNYAYTLTLTSCSKLTEQSIINILNNLYDIKTKGCQSQKVVLGSTNLAKLTSEEGQTALSMLKQKVGQLVRR